MQLMTSGQWNWPPRSAKTRIVNTTAINQHWLIELCIKMKQKLGLACVDVAPYTLAIPIIQITSTKAEPKSNRFSANLSGIMQIEWRVGLYDLNSRQPAFHSLVSGCIQAISGLENQNVMWDSVPLSQTCLIPIDFIERRMVSYTFILEKWRNHDEIYPKSQKAPPTDTGIKKKWIPFFISLLNAWLSHLSLHQIL